MQTARVTKVGKVPVVLLQLPAQQARFVKPDELTSVGTKDGQAKQKSKDTSYQTCRVYGQPRSQNEGGSKSKWLAIYF